MTSEAYREEVLSIRHLDDIILALEIHGVMSHSEICSYLNLKESTLSEIMKKVNLTKLIISSRSGKYKLYRLTDAGRRLGKQLRSQTNKNLGEEELLFQLQHYYESTKSKEEFSCKVKDILKYGNIIANASNSIMPNKHLTIFYSELGKIEKEEFEVTGILEKGRMDNSNFKIMAKKLTYHIDMIQNIQNSKNEEEYA